MKTTKEMLRIGTLYNELLTIGYNDNPWDKVAQKVLDNASVYAGVNNIPKYITEIVDGTGGYYKIAANEINIRSYKFNNMIIEFAAIAQFGLEEINSSCINRQLNVIWHELRHAWQYETYGPSYFNGYVSCNSKELIAQYGKKKTIEMYKKQACEADARNFALEMTQKVFSGQISIDKLLEGVYEILEAEYEKLLFLFDSSDLDWE